MRILNLTQHSSSPEQKEEGVIDLSEQQRIVLGRWLTFDALPNKDTIATRVKLLVQAASNDSIIIGHLGVPFDAAMVGGAPYLMAPLEAALREAHILPLYAFSVRDSVETIAPNGSVTKTTVFKHGGFVGMDGVNTPYDEFGVDKHGFDRTGRDTIED